MSAPDNLPRDVADFLAKARSGAPEPAPELQQRVWTRVTAAVGSGGGGDPGAAGGSGAGTGAAPASGLGSALLAPTLIGLGIAGAIAAATIGYRAMSRAESQPTTVRDIATHAPPAPMTPPSPGVVSESPGAAPSESPVALPRKPRRSSPRSVEGLDAEMRLIDGATAALRGGDLVTADNRLDDHARRYPRGQLGEERELLRVRLAIAKNHVDVARRLADEFLRRYPRSAHRAALEQALVTP